MHILHFYKRAAPYSVGGVERIIDELASGAAKMGHAVDVLTVGDVHDTREINGYKVHCCPTLMEAASTPVSLGAIAKFRELSRRADVINYHYPWPFMDVAHFLSAVRSPTVVTYHSDIVRQRFAETAYAPLRQMFFNSVDAIVATSPNYRATSVTLQRYSEQTEVIPLGISDATASAPSPDALNRWRTRIGERFFLFVGVLRYYKGLHLLLDAAQGTGIPIVIAGSGPTEASLRKQAQSLTADNIHIVGQVSEADKAALLSLCCGVVFPSHLRSEAFGVTLLEGAMHGKPLISSEIGTGTSYVNIHDETGLVVVANDAIALRSALQRLWNDTSAAEAMGRRARARYEKLFTGRLMSGAYLGLYERLVARRAAAMHGYDIVPSRN